MFDFRFVGVDNCMAQKLLYIVDYNLLAYHRDKDWQLLGKIVRLGIYFNIFS